MAVVYLSLGSNIDREIHILAALERLNHLFAPLQCSSVYESHAVGFEGENFLNMIVCFYTELAVGPLVHLLRQLEEDNGRDRQAPRFSARTLDVDVLMYDQCVGCIDGVKLPRDEITQHAFVLKPLAELIPDTLHPEIQKSYRDLWENFDQGSQALWPVSFIWRGKNLSQ